MLRVRVEADIYPAVLDSGSEYRTFTRWASYSVEHDLRNVFPTVRLAAGGPGEDLDWLREVLDYNPEAIIRVDGTKVATMRLVSDVCGYSRKGGTTVQIIGAGKTQAADNDAMPLGWTCGERTILDSAKDIMSPAGVEVVCEATEAQRTVATRRTRTRTYQIGQAHRNALGEWVPDPATEETVTTTYFDDRAVRPRVGETRLGFLRRMLSFHGLFAWETPDGKLFIGMPQPAAAEPAITYDVENQTAGEGRIHEVTRTRRYGTYHPEIQIVGRVGRHGRAAVDYLDSDTSFLDAGWTGRAIYEAQDIRGNEEAGKRARRMRADERLRAYEVAASIGGHGVGSALAAVDRNVAINCPQAGLRNARLYCIKRAFEHSKRGGTRTSLGLIRRGLWEQVP